MKSVLLKQNGYIQEITLKITKHKKEKPVSLYYKQFKKYITKARKKTVHIEEIDTWMINTKSKLIGYGISDEQSGSDVNKHELLPTNNNKKYYGDILIIKTDEDNKIDDVTADQYEKYYNQMYNLGKFDSDSDEDGVDEFDFSAMIEQYYSYSGNSEQDNISDSDHDSNSDDSELDSQSGSLLQPIINSSQYKKRIKNMIKELEYEAYSIDSI